MAQTFAFKLIPKPTFIAAVQLTVPGQPEPAEVDFTFIHKGRLELALWRSQVQAPADPEKLKTWVAPKDVDFLAEVITDWGRVDDPEGKPVPYSKNALEELLDNYPAAAGEIYGGYLRAQTESRAKN